MPTLEKGVWSLRWECCQECGTIRRRHKGKGLCTLCYQRQWHGERLGHCIECGSEISVYAERCYACANRRRWECGIYDEAFDEECSRKHSKAIEAAWARGDFDGVFTSEEYRQKRSKLQKAAWERGDYDSEETRRRMSESSKAVWARGAYEGRSEKLSQAIQAAWAQGDYDNDDFRQKNAETTRAAWERGAFDNAFDEEMRRKVSEAKRANWTNGVYDDCFEEEWRRKVSEGMKAAWEQGLFDSEEYRQKLSEKKRQNWADGIYDNVFQPPTSIELQVAAALDILGIEHQPQYRPDGYGCVYDEFVPPATLIEVHGDYWHGDSRPDIQKRDAAKAQWAADNGFNLIVIWEHEINEFGAWALVMKRVGGA